MKRLAFALLVASTAQAQVPKSQLATVTQSLAGASIEITYRRPSARGRELFGALVPWDRVWTPSADSAVRFTTSAPLIVNGAELAAGSYSVWAKPGQKEWEWIFNSNPAVFHLRYSADTDVLHVKSSSESSEPATETLTFFFSAADADSATLRMQWGKTSVPLRIKKKPQ